MGPGGVSISWRVLDCVYHAAIGTLEADHPSDRALSIFCFAVPVEPWRKDRLPERPEPESALREKALAVGDDPIFHAGSFGGVGGVPPIKILWTGAGACGGGSPNLPSDIKFDCTVSSSPPAAGGRSSLARISLRVMMPFCENVEYSAERAAESAARRSSRSTVKYCVGRSLTATKERCTSCSRPRTYDRSD